MGGDERQRRAQPPAEGSGQSLPNIQSARDVPAYALSQELRSSHAGRTQASRVTNGLPLEDIDCGVEGGGRDSFPTLCGHWQHEQL